MWKIVLIAAAVATLLGCTAERGAPELHRYVGCAPSCANEGTSPGDCRNFATVTGLQVKFKITFYHEAWLLQPENVDRLVRDLAEADEEMEGIVSIRRDLMRLTGAG